MNRFLIALVLLQASDTSSAELKEILSKPILEKDRIKEEIQADAKDRLVPLPEFQNPEDWNKYADDLREEVLSKIVFRGADDWRKHQVQVEWLDTIPGGPGYRIQKLRYECLPGLWIPALLYRPENITGKVPVVLNVNGHSAAGKQTDYKQLRCINLAKKGMIALNVEWLGMGQFSKPEYSHYKMNQLDLCGVSGLAPFYLNMVKGLDLLLELPEADHTRVGLAGLSGGGWQTIILGSLDRRVTLINPVAGYSSFKTRMTTMADLGDSEQTPTDLGTIADYEHLTTLCAPRALLLTYNAKDNCCFVAAGALPPLLDAARPVYAGFGKPEALRSHINHEPGDHNFGLENREQFYAMIGEHFYPNDPNYSAKEVPSESEVKSVEELMIPLPENNHTFQSMAREASKSLPQYRTYRAFPDRGRGYALWRAQRIAALQETLKLPEGKIEVTEVSREEQGELTVRHLRCRLDQRWSFSVVDLQPKDSKSTRILLADLGRGGASEQIQQLLENKTRVFALDPWGFGESRVTEREALFALLQMTTGRRPLGIAVAQLHGFAEYLKTEEKIVPELHSIGPRTSIITLLASAMTPPPAIHLEQGMSSLKELIDGDKGVIDSPELFCFGLLKEIDVQQLMVLSSPRKIQLINPSKELEQTHQAALKDALPE